MADRISIKVMSSCFLPKSFYHSSLNDSGYDLVKPFPILIAKGKKMVVVHPQNRYSTAKQSLELSKSVLVF